MKNKTATVPNKKTRQVKLDVWNLRSVIVYVRLSVT